MRMFTIKLHTALDVEKVSSVCEASFLLPNSSSVAVELCRNAVWTIFFNLVSPTFTWTL